MKKRRLCFSLFIIHCSLFIIPTLDAQQSKIGYVYPAGGQQGKTVEVLIGGKQISRADDVLISGTGVRGRIIKGYGSMRINDAETGKVAHQLYMEARRELESDIPRSNREVRREERKEEKTQTSSIERKADKVGSNLNRPETKDIPKAKPGEEIPLPSPEEVMRKHLYLDRLAHPTADDLQLIYYEYFSPRPDKKPKEAIAQGLLVELTIDKDAEPGDRELRLITQTGLTVPVRFVVGTIPEINELEPNDFNASPQEQFEMMGGEKRGGGRINLAPKTIRQLEPQNLPITINGQARNGDTDRFPFNAKKGQKLVIGVQARHLVPYLADAVPGWFQAAVSLYDSDGTKIADASSFRFDPDPVILFEVPKDGVYHVEIQDSIFRGRDDFVYRLTIAESPIVLSMFPLGGKLGTSTGVDIDGWNLPGKVSVLDTQTGKPGIRTMWKINKKNLLFPIRYAVDTLPERLESEPNDSRETATKIQFPVILNGRINTPDDVDYYSFKAKKGDKVVLDVAAVSLGSPLDSSLELLDESGKIVAACDDRADSSGPNVGLETHHADPYILFEIPSDGVYTAKIFNLRQQGETNLAYRLRISAPRPDFSVYCEPSSLNFLANTQPVKFHVVRKDGFDGDVKIRIAGNNSEFRLDGAKIPSGTNNVFATMSATAPLEDKPFKLSFEAVAEIDGKEIVQRIIPVDDMEQAFIYHHWVPSESLMVLRGKNRQVGSAPSGFGFLQDNQRSRYLSVALKPGGESTLRLPIPKAPPVAKGRNQKRSAPTVDKSRISFSLNDPPEGVTLESSKFDDDELSLVFKTEETVKPKTAGNLIVNIKVKADKGKQGADIKVGVLPAIAFVVE